MRYTRALGADTARFPDLLGAGVIVSAPED